MSDAVDLVIAVASLPLMHFAAKHGLKALVARIKEFSERGTREVSAALTENYQDFANDYAQTVDYLLRREFERTTNEEELREQIEDVASNGDTHRIIAAFAFEAMREALPARREMLAHAAAYLTLTPMALEEKARCERALRQLDPVHVMQLYGLSRVATKFFESVEQKDIGHVRHGIWLRLPDGEVLETSGCIRLTFVAITYGAHPRPDAAVINVTRTGNLVLRVLADYTRGRDVPFAVPGREMPKDGRDATSARAFFDAQVPGLRERLALLARTHETRYDAPGWDYRNQTIAPPAAEEPGAIWIGGVDGAIAAELRGLRPFHPINHEEMRNKRSLREIAIDAREIDKKWRVIVHGPHDVLRVIADDIDAPL